LKLDAILLITLSVVLAGTCNAADAPAEGTPPAGDECCPAAGHAESDHAVPADLPPIEKTDDDSSIAIQHQHTMVDLAEGELQVSDVITAVNSGEKAVVAKDPVRGTFRVTLPDGATDPQLGGEFGHHGRIDGNAAIFTSEFRPGSKKFVVQYFIRYDQPKIHLTRRLDYNTRAIGFIFPDGTGATVSSADFTEKKIVNMGKHSYQYLSAQDCKAGDTMAVEITMPMPPANKFRFLALAAVVLAGGLIVGLGFSRKASA